MTTVRWRCTSCPAEGIGQGQAHVDKTLHAVIASTDETPLQWPLCTCGHRQGIHAHRREVGPRGRCLVVEGCACGAFEEEVA